MPFAMCASTGGVPQWYMKTPESPAVKLNVKRLAGCDVLERAARCDARRVEVDRVRDRAVVAQRDDYLVALLDMDHRARGAAGERPAAYFTPGAISSSTSLSAIV